MKYVFTVVLFSFSCTLLGQVSTHIHVDQFGYLSNSNKVAVISNPQVGFNAGDSYNPGKIEVRNADTDEVLLDLQPVQWSNGATHTKSGDKGWWVDFSSINTTGNYYLYDLANSASSATFVISDIPYNDVLKTAGRAFYYNRCNAEKLEEHAGAKWVDGNSFEKPQQDYQCRDVADQTNENTAKNLSGGWFDAGDFNKYVNFAGSSIHDLLWAYEFHPNAFSDSWNIPESDNGIPDVLDEVRYELDWILKMNNPVTGATLLKVGSTNHSQNAASPPSINTAPRYYIGECSSAAVYASGMFAHAARVFKKYGNENSNDALLNFSNQLESRAIITFDYAKEYKANNGWDTECDWGQVVSGDADANEIEQDDELLAAAVHLYELTDNEEYNQHILDNTEQTEQLVSKFWGAYKMELNSALLFYTTLNGADANLSSKIIDSFATDINDNNNGYYEFNSDDLYRVSMPNWSYHWGSNLAMCNYANLNYLAEKYKVLDDTAIHTFLEKAADVAHYLHGVNPLGKVYLTNMYEFGGENCVNEFYHQWFQHGTIYDHVFDSPNGPAPGYLVGGPNNFYEGSSPFLDNNQPMQKAYADFNDVESASWELTEPSISYQAGYVRLMAQFVDAALVSSDIETIEKQRVLSLFPNPTQDLLNIQVKLPEYEIELISSTGQLLSLVTANNNTHQLNTAYLVPGTYFIRVKSKEGRRLSTRKFVKH